MDNFTTVTDRILKQLDEGVLPWRKTWASGLPKNLTTGKEYRGINILILSTTGYNSCYWVTFRQALHLGGNVRKGEKGTPVIYWHWRTPEDLVRLQEKTGKADFAPCVPFISTVFNLAQVEGVARPDADLVRHHDSRLELADNVFDMMPDKPEIVHTCMSEPGYSWRGDRVTLPHLSQFENADEYYAALFHELVHASGHQRRLNRVAERTGSRTEQYSFEELVAEFGASFLCAFAGIHNPASEQLAAGYISHWAEVFRKDSRILMRAASAAQRATDYIRGKIIPAVDQDEAIPCDTSVMTAEA
jgi:antirestriction protein ArdC